MVSDQMCIDHFLSIIWNVVVLINMINYEQIQSSQPEPLHHFH